MNNYKIYNLLIGLMMFKNLIGLRIPVHLENIKFIFSTFNLLKLDSSIYFNTLHPSNILSISLTFNVLKLIKIMDSNEIHSANMDSYFLSYL